MISPQSATVAAFVVKLQGGGTLHGRIDLKAVVERDKVIAHADVRITREPKLSG